jgi:hypothetical protein
MTEPVAPPNPNSLMALIVGQGWYVVWGSSAPNPGLTQLVVAFGLASDGTAAVPIVHDGKGDLVNAAVISQDFVLSHPHQNLDYQGLVSAPPQARKETDSA